MKIFKTLKIGQNREGTALLVALMIMGILMVLSLGLSRLIIGDVRSIRDQVDAGTAYYLAEAGIEKALLDLHQQLPGYQTKAEGDDLYFGEKDQQQKTNFKIFNQTKVFPHRDGDEFNLNEKKATPAFFYNDLKLNESITIPLFSHDGEKWRGSGKEGTQGNVDNFKNFRLEYYVGYKGALNEGVGGEWILTNNDVDVLRWKIFGINKETGETEALSDYFPVTDGSNAKRPMCMGTKAESGKKLAQSISDNPIITECHNGKSSDGRYAREYYKNIGPKDNRQIIHFTDSPPNKVYNNEAALAERKAKLKLGRQVEAVENNPVVNPDRLVTDKKPQLLEGLVNPVVNLPKDRNLTPYPISQFMEEHDNVYLTITNIINTKVIKSVIDSESARKEIANIKYRLLVFPEEGDKDDKNTVREFATVKAEGFYNGVKQSIDAKVRMDQFLPVFTFSLYRTDSGEE